MTPIWTIPDGAWFEHVHGGVASAVGQRLAGEQDGDVKVRYRERWGKASKEELWISSASPVRRIAAPTPAGPPDAAEAVAPDVVLAPQEEVHDPFED